MVNNKSYNFLKSLPGKLNLFYKKKSIKKITLTNKSSLKSQFDPVTNLDKSFETFIRKLIGKKFPDHSIIGEEFNNKISHSDYKWVIDPIDGTRAFIIGLPTWSNLIGLSFMNEPLYGLANFPELDKFYINDQKKSYVFIKKKKYILKSSGNKDIKKIKGVYNLNNKLGKKIKNKLGGLLKQGTFDALNYCLLAEGKLDVVIEANLKPFDILPLIPILKKSGAVITTWKNDKAENAGNIIASSNKILHNKIIKLFKT